MAKRRGRGGATVAGVMVTAVSLLGPRSHAPAASLWYSKDWQTAVSATPPIFAVPCAWSFRCQQSQLKLRGGALEASHSKQCAADIGTEQWGYGRGGIPPTTKDVHYLNNAGVGAALSVNSEGQVVFAQMVPGMPAAKSGAVNIGDVLVRFLPLECYSTLQPHSSSSPDVASCNSY